MKTFNFPFSKGQKGGVSSVDYASEHYYNNQLTQLLTTNKLERVMNPTYGINLESYIFDTLNEGLINIIKMEIVDTINVFCTDIDVRDDDVEVYAEHTSIQIKIRYKIKVTNEIYQFDLKLN
ncbi:MAG: GPW/gp25 family protein [Peptostreptococcaceae bacterium]